MSENKPSVLRIDDDEALATELGIMLAQCITSSTSQAQQGDDWASKSLTMLAILYNFGDEENELLAHFLVGVVSHMRQSWCAQYFGDDMPLALRSKDFKLEKLREAAAFLKG